MAAGGKQRATRCRCSSRINGATTAFDRPRRRGRGWNAVPTERPGAARSVGSTATAPAAAAVHVDRGGWRATVMGCDRETARQGRYEPLWRGLGRRERKLLAERREHRRERSCSGRGTDCAEKGGGCWGRCVKRWWSQRASGRENVRRSRGCTFAIDCRGRTKGRDGEGARERTVKAGTIILFPGKRGEVRPPRGKKRGSWKNLEEDKKSTWLEC